MKIDTNTPYKVPQEYEVKNKYFEPKTKGTSIFMIILGAILIIAFTVAVILGGFYGVSKLIEAIAGA